MFKKQVFFIPFLFFFLPAITLAQNGTVENTAPSDTICFKVEQVNLIKQKVEKLQYRDSLNTEIINELKFQVKRLEDKTRSLEREVILTEKQLELYKKRIKNTENKRANQNTEAKLWFYTAGGAVSGFLMSLLFF